jgi:hypothetical protein
MKKEINSVDDFFKKSLQNHKVTPSETARSRFLDEVSAKSGKGGFHLLRWYTILTVAFIITASALLYSYYSKEDAPVSEKVLANTSADNTLNSGQNEDSLKQIKSITQTTVSVGYPPAEPKTAISSMPVVQQNISTGTTSGIIHEKAIALVPEIQKNATEQKTSTLPQPQEEQLAESHPISTVNEVKEKDPMITNYDTVSEIPKAIPENKAAEGPSFVANNPVIAPIEEPERKPLVIPPASEIKLSAFLLYSFDWNLKSSSNSLVHSLNLEGKIQYKRFSFTSGAGVTATTGFDNYEVQYSDYLGMYRKLDSITFAYDAKQYYLEPTYYMSDVNVWDSTVKRDSYQVEKRYNQLKIPLLFGYDIISRNKFALSLKTGVEMFFYLDSHTISRSEYDAGKNQIVSTTQQPEDLKNTNLWFMLSLSADYYFTRRLVIEVEPQMKSLLTPDKSGSSQTNKEFEPALRTSVKLKF